MNRKSQKKKLFQHFTALTTNLLNLYEQIASKGLMIKLHMLFTRLKSTLNKRVGRNKSFGSLVLFHKLSFSQQTII